MIMSKHFIIVKFDNGGLVVGTAADESLKNWRTKNSKLCISWPRALQLIPDEAGNPQLMVVNVFPTKTKQSQIWTSPSIVDVIGSIKVENKVEYCEEDQPLFTAYQSAVDAWKQECSNVVAPTAEEMSNVVKLR